MAVQKHNTYYDNELYYYDENGVRKPLQVGKIYSAGSGIKIENDVISVSGKYVASASTALDGKRLVLVNNEWTELIIPSGSDWSQTIQEASAYAYNAATAWTDTQGYLTAHQIIPSAKWENASDIVETNSAKWNDGYNTLSSNSGNWVKKEELYSVSSTLNTNKLDISSFDEYKDLVNEELEKKQDKSAMSAYAFSSWVDENYQKKGNYLSANALDLISDTSGKWNEVSSKLDKNAFTTWSANYDEYVKSIENDVGNLKSNSSNWDSVYNNVNTNSAKWYAASDEVTSNSANWTSAARALEASADKWNTTHEQFNTSSVKWNELYNEYQVSSKLWNDTTNTVKTFSGYWNDVSSKADKLDFENLSGKVETLSGELKTTSSFLSSSIDGVSAEFKKIVYTSATENMATTDDVAKLEQTISETYQVKGEYLTTADSSNFYPSNNPSGFITGVDLSNYYNKNETSSKNELDTAFGSKQDNLTQEQLSAISSVSSIKGTVLVGDSNIRTTSAEDGNNIKWTLELTAKPVVTDTTLSGYDGIVATKDSTVSSQWNVGIAQVYKEQIESVSSKLTQDVANTLYAPISVTEDVETLKSASAGWNEVSAIYRIDSIESNLANKKDKQTELNFNGSATKTIKSITQNTNGEINVEYEDIDLPKEVPNVEITSEDNSVNVVESTDIQTNTKTYDISVSDSVKSKIKDIKINSDTIVIIGD